MNRSDKEGPDNVIIDSGHGPLQVVFLIDFIILIYIAPGAYLHDNQSLTSQISLFLFGAAGDLKFYSTYKT